jgi:hypothetical protein
MNEHTPVAITEAQAAEVVAGFQRGALDELDLVGIAQDWRE